MQPAASIAPYNREKVKKLVGRLVRMPFSERYPEEFRTYKIVSIKFESRSKVLIIGDNGWHRTGWRDLTTATFKTQKTDPLVVAICKAREAV